MNALIEILFGRVRRMGVIVVGEICAKECAESRLAMQLVDQRGVVKKRGFGATVSASVFH